jgi:hypothetical protein
MSPLTYKPKPTNEPPYVNVLLYGPPKTGKTAGATTTTRQGGVVLINGEASDNATRYAHRHDPKDRIHEVEWDENPLQTLVDVTTEVMKQVGQQRRTIHTVILDPINEIHRRLIEGLSAGRMRPTLDQYGDAAIHLERFCRKMCELPVNFVIVAHERETDKDEATGVIDRLVLTATSNPAIGAKVMGMVDVLGYTGVKVGDDGTLQYLTQLAPGAGRRGGDRFDCLGIARLTDVGEWIATIHAAEAGSAAPAENDGGPSGPESPTESEAEAAAPAASDAPAAAEPAGSGSPPEPERRPPRNRRDIASEVHAEHHQQPPAPLRAEEVVPPERIAAEEARLAAEIAADELREAEELAAAEAAAA